MPFDGVTYLCCTGCGGFVVEGEAEAHERWCRGRPAVANVGNGEINNKECVTDNVKPIGVQGGVGVPGCVCVAVLGHEQAGAEG